MTFTIQLAIELDEDLIASIAEKRGVPVDQVIKEIAGDCECRAHDAIRWRHAVDRVGVSIG